MHMIYNFSG